MVVALFKKSVRDYRVLTVGSETFDEVTTTGGVDYPKDAWNFYKVGEEVIF